LPRLQVNLLGGLEIHLDNQPLPKPPTLKSQSLLAFLILNRRQAQARDRLIGLFWGDRPERRARRSLTTALWHLRRCLSAGEYLLSDSHQVQFDPQADLGLDVDQFKTLAQQETPHDLQTAADLYRGDLLENFYDDWLITERYRLQTMFFEILAKLMTGQEQAGAYQPALATALRLLEHDPLREDAHRLVMNAYCRLGRRHAALEHYQRCRELLRAELDLELLPETAALYQAILDGQVPETTSIQEATRPPGLTRRRPSEPGKGNFVGREHELSLLNQQWEQVQEGQGAAVLVRGEAGVGKSRLLAEFVERLRWQGARVLEGKCYQFERALPYQPIADALRTVLSTLDPAELPSFSKWVWRELARLVPELLEREPELAAGSAIHTDEERVRLFDAVGRFLASLSSRGPLIMVLEDLHWATESSLQLLHYLARQLSGRPLLMVVTWRPEAVSPKNPLAALQEQLVRERLAQVLDLGRLSPSAVESLVVSWSGAGEAVAPLAHRLYEETEGNPYFLIEMVTTLLDTGVIRLEEGVWQGDFLEISQDKLPLPAGVSETLLARVGRLGEQAQKLLRLAAVLGRQFDYDPLQSAWGRGEEATLEALDELLRRKLIREGSGPAGKDYIFDHALVQETIYRSIHYRRRQQLHRLAGRTMEHLYAHDPSAAGELAHHFERAGQTDIALGYLVTAGEQAQAIFAFREALGLFARALALAPAERTDALVARALAGWSASRREINGDDPQIWEHLDKALEIWKQLDEPAQVAGCYFMLAFQYADFGQARTLVRQGLDAIQGKKLEHLKSRAWGLLARFHEHEGNFAQARVWAEQQRQVGKEIGDQSELARAYHRLGSILLRIGGPMGMAADHSQKAAQLAEDLGWLDFAAGSHNIAGHCLLALGRTGEAEVACRRAWQLSVELDIPWRQAWCYHSLAEIASRRGNWEQAHQLLDQAEALMVQQPSHFQEIAILRTRGQVFGRQGDLETACPVLEKALAMSQRYYPRYLPSLELSLVTHCLPQDDLPAAQQKLARALEHLAESSNDHAQSSAQRLRGQLAARNGDWATAEEAFAQGLHLSNTLQQVIEGAKIQLAWGESFLSHDPDRARELLKSALATFEAAEAQYLIERIQDLLP